MNKTKLKGLNHNTTDFFKKDKVARLILFTHPHVVIKPVWLTYVKHEDICEKKNVEKNWIKVDWTDPQSTKNTFVANWQKGYRLIMGEEREWTSGKFVERLLKEIAEILPKRKRSGEYNWKNGHNQVTVRTHVNTGAEALAVSHFLCCIVCLFVILGAEQWWECLCFFNSFFFLIQPMKHLKYNKIQWYSIKLLSYVDFCVVLYETQILSYHCIEFDFMIRNANWVDDWFDSRA